MTLAFFYFFDSPEEKMLKREKDEILTNYQFLSRELDELQGVLKEIQYRDENIYRTIFQAEPISGDVRKGGFGGANSYEKLRGLDSKEIVANTAKRFDVLAKQLYIQSKSFDEIAHLAKSKKDMVNSVPAIMPISFNQLTRVSSLFGYRTDPIYGTLKMHEGMDFTAKQGTPIHVTGDGTVIEVSNSRSGYGNCVIVNHGYGYKTLYAHLHTWAVRPGQKVKRGEIIATVGNTGKSVGPHLHYEVRKNDIPIDPINFYFDDISPEQYQELIEQALQPGGQTLD